MSTDNLETVRQVLAAIRERDLARLVALTDPEVEWQSFFALGAEYHGHEGLREYVHDIDESFSDLEPRPTGLICTGDVVLGVGTVYYRGRQSGIAAESPAAWVLRVRDGKVVLFRAFREPERHLGSVGLDR